VRSLSFLLNPVARQENRERPGVAGAAVAPGALIPRHLQERTEQRRPRDVAIR